MDRNISTTRKYPDIIFLSLAGIITGILLAYNGISLSFLILLPIVLSFWATVFNRRFLVFTFFLLISSLQTFQQTAIPATHISRATIEKINGLSGKVLRCRETSFAVRYVILVNEYHLNDKTVHKTSGKVRLTSGNARVFPVGSFISARNVSLQEIPPPKNPGESDFRREMYKQRCFIEGKAGDIVLLSPYANRLTYIFGSIRKSLSRRLDKSFLYFPEERALLETMTIGRQDIPYFLTERGKRSGIYHLLVVSGLHLTFLVLFLRILFIPFRNLNNRYPKFFPSVSLLVLWLYAGITGFNIPVVRAVLMMSFFFLGEILEQEINGFQSISFAAILVLLLNPLNLFDVSFQLSFAATAGILFFIKRYGITVKNKFGTELLVSLGAQVSVLPLIMYHFGMFYPIGFVSNLVFPTLAGIILLFFPLFLVLPFLFIPLRLLLSLFLYLACLVAQVSYGIKVELSLLLAILMYLFIFLCFNRMKIKKKIASMFLVVLTASYFLLFPYVVKKPAEKHLYLLSLKKPAVIFINEHQMTAFLSDSYRRQETENVLIPFLREKKPAEVSLFYTDISYNHIGTFNAIKGQVRNKKVFEHESVKKSLFYPYLSVYCYNNSDVPFAFLDTGVKIPISDLQIEILGEEKGKLSYAITKENKTILIAPYIGQEIAEKIKNRRFYIACIWDMKTTVKVKRLLENLQFDYLILPKKLKKFQVFDSIDKTFYLSQSAVVVNFSTHPWTVGYYNPPIP